MEKKISVYYDRSIKMKAEFAKKSTETDKNKLVKDFVDFLRREGLNDSEIQQVLNIELMLDSQGNRQMISANADYKAAVAKALGVKK
jgi:ADP-dependent phosphofructokinase/glucokinase